MQVSLKQALYMPITKGRHMDSHHLRIALMGPGLETWTGFLSCGHCFGVPLVSQFILKTCFPIVFHDLMPLSWDLMHTPFQCLRQSSCLTEDFSSLTEDKHICSGRNVLYPHFSECTVTRLTKSQFEDSFLHEVGYILQRCLLSFELLDYKDCASDCHKLLLQKLFSSKKNYRKHVVNCCCVKEQQL